MDIIKKILSFLNSKIFIYIIIGLGVLIYLRTCSVNSSLKDQNELNIQNITAVNDTIKTEREKNGNYKTSITGYKADSKELSKYNKELAQKVKEEEGKVITLNNTVLEITMDNKELKNTIDSFSAKYDSKRRNDSVWDLAWEIPYMYDSIPADSLNYDVFNGNTSVTIRGNFSKEDLQSLTIHHDKTFLTNRYSKMTASFGQKYDKDGKIIVFINTKHPYITPALLEGVYVDYPKKKHWFQGIGVGPTVNVGITAAGKPGIFVGIGIHYNVWKK